MGKADLPVSAEFEPVGDASDADRLPGRMEKPWGRGDGGNYVAAVIPGGFTAYARILHPAYDIRTRQEVSWREVAIRNGHTPHAQMQWQSIAASGSAHRPQEFDEPATGHLPEIGARALVDILARFTDTPEDCRFAVWEGWGIIDRDRWSGAASLRLPDRTYILLRGPIEAATRSISPPFRQSAGLWWPRDRAWCVVTEIDLMWTYVGGSVDCIEAILSDDRLESWPATLDDRVDIHGDRINRESGRSGG